MKSRRSFLKQSLAAAGAFAALPALSRPIIEKPHERLGRKPSGGLRFAQQAFSDGTLLRHRPQPWSHLQSDRRYDPWWRATRGFLFEGE
ncbi:MAG: twin-arginine translocation signal domain-containing protein [Bacteroidota bacterium]